MTEKIFVGRVQESKYGVNIGLTQKDLDLLASNLNGRGWVNISVSKSKKGNWYGELCQDRPKIEEQPAPQETEQEEYPF